VLTTDQKGAIAEAKIAAAAIERGIGVYRPLFEGGRCDLILEIEGKLLRVQCKWAPRQGEVVVIRCYSCRRAREGMRKRSYTPEEIDAFGAYCADLDRCYLVPIDRVRSSTRSISLRLSPTRNSQRRRILWADDFAFGRLHLEQQGAIAQLGERLHGMQEVAGSIPAGSTELGSAQTVSVTTR
jgi:hypothetical protein